MFYKQLWCYTRYAFTHGKRTSHFGCDIYSGGQSYQHTSISLPARNGLKSAISLFCCSVSLGNSLNFQTLILITQRDFCAPHRDLILIQSVWNDMKKRRRTKSRRTISQDASRNLPEKLCSSAPRAALNTKDAHT